MKPGITTCLALTCLFTFCGHPTASENREPERYDQDAAAVSNTVHTIYNNIRVESNQHPDFDLIVRQFAEGAHLGYIREDSLILKTPENYFESMKELLSRGEVRYLREWEIEGETKIFGNMAQHTSHYGVHFNTTDSLAEQGIINFHLIKSGHEWRVVSMIWEAERDGLKIPDTYFECPDHIKN